jgi:hypothetical protein
MKKSKPKRKYKSYEVGKPGLQFECKFAVFPRKMGCSVCYCTDVVRATMIAKALTMYVETPAFERFLWEKRAAAKKLGACDVKLEDMPKLLTKFPKPKGTRHARSQGS